MKMVLLRLEARLLERGEPFSCMLFALLTLPMLGLLFLLQAYALHTPEVSSLYRVQPLAWVQSLVAALMLALLAVAAWGWRWRQAMRSPPGLVTGVVAATLLVFLALSLAYGLKDSPLCMVLIQEIVVARALFSQRAVTPSLALGALALVWAEWCWRTGAMPYAPLLAHPIYTGHDLLPWWAFMPRVVFAVSIAMCSVMLFFFFGSLSRQRKALESLVRSDALTGLANRREFMAQIELEAHRQLRDGQPFCVVLCDIDHFKKVNDTWGHPVGDEVLAGVGRLLASQTRHQLDVAARLGGEEFGLILPGTDVLGAQRVANKIAKALRALTFEANGHTFVVTQSVGVAQVVNGMTDHALRVADEHLYAAKRAGRDRIVIG